MKPEVPAANDPARVSENPVHGTRHIFLVTGEETGGEYVRVKVELPPGARGTPMHFQLRTFLLRHAPVRQTPDRVTK